MELVSECHPHNIRMSLDSDVLGGKSKQTIYYLSIWAQQLKNGETNSRYTHFERSDHNNVQF